MTNKIIIIALATSVGARSQVGINTTNPKGVLDIVSNNLPWSFQGWLIPTS